MLLEGNPEKIVSRDNSNRGLVSSMSFSMSKGLY